MNDRIEHGTRKGYQQHKAVGSMVCERCRLANNAYMADYMRRRYTPERRRAAYERAKVRGYYDREAS